MPPETRSGVPLVSFRRVGGLGADRILDGVRDPDDPSPVADLRSCGRSRRHGQRADDLGAQLLVKSIDPQLIEALDPTNLPRAGALIAAAAVAAALILGLAGHFLIDEADTVNRLRESRSQCSA